MASAMKDFLLAPFRVLARFFNHVRFRLRRAKSNLIQTFVQRTILKLTGPGQRLEIAPLQVPWAPDAPLRHYKNAPKTLGEWYEKGRAHGEKEFIAYVGKPGDPSRSLTYDAYLDDVNSVIKCLQALGVKPGDKVAIVMSNVPEFCVAFAAITTMGAVAVTLNAFWEGAEIEFGLRDSGSTVLFTDEKRFARILNKSTGVMDKGAGVKTVIVVNPTPELLKSNVGVPLHAYEALVGGQRGDTSRAVVAPVDTFSDALIMYTSGTTNGRPKGVVQTHISCVQTVMCFQLFSDLVAALRGPQKRRRVDLLTSPLFHAAALTATFLLSFEAGNKLVMMPRWIPDEALKICVDHQVTFFGAMPAMLSDILQSPYFKEHKHELAFTNIGTGGAAIPSELIRRTYQALPAVTQGTGWGMTETNSIGTIMGGPDYIDSPLACGRPHQIVDIQIIDPETLEVLTGPDAVGELCLRSPCNMRGYHNLPEETARVCLPGGWIRTGDIGRVDVDGFYYIVDRYKDLVIRGGENISCNEVEDCVYGLPGHRVVEAAAFGLPDARLGEILAVAVAVKPGATLEAEEVRTWCAENLAKFKVPRVVFLRSDPLPRGTTGKILKRQLKQEYTASEAVAAV